LKLRIWVDDERAPAGGVSLSARIALRSCLSIGFDAASKGPPVAAAPTRPAASGASASPRAAERLDAKRLVVDE
jgi:hypothetical protein